MTIGEKIKQHRKQANITQAKLAELTGIPPISIRKYEAGHRKPKFEQIVRIANALDIAPCIFCDYYKEV